MASGDLLDQQVTTSDSLADWHHYFWIKGLKNYFRTTLVQTHFIYSGSEPLVFKPVDTKQLHTRYTPWSNPAKIIS